MKTCPKCHTKNPDEANYCRHCVYAFHPVIVIRKEDINIKEDVVIISQPSQTKDKTYITTSVPSLKASSETITNQSNTINVPTERVNTQIPQKDGSNFSIKGSTIAYYPNTSKGHTFLKQTLDNDWKACRTGAITDTAGVIVREANGYAYTTGIPKKLADTLQDANSFRYFIKDVALSNNHRYWCVVYDDGVWCPNAPKPFTAALKKYALNREKIISIALNDTGEYAIITDKHIFASSQKIMNIIKYAENEYGSIHSVSLSNKGVIVCAERGVYFNNIPSIVCDMMKNALRIFKIKVVRFTDSGTCLITDGKSKVIHSL